MDMREPESIAEGVAKAVAAFGRLDIVVYNAAILVPGTIESIQQRHIDLIWQVDLKEPMLVVREAIPPPAGGGWRADHQHLLARGRLPPSGAIQGGAQGWRLLRDD